VEDMDKTFIIVSLIVWAGLAVLAATVGTYSVVGTVFTFIVFMLAVAGWVKLIRIWLEERSGKEEEPLREEIRRLREAVEELRKALES